MTTDMQMMESEAMTSNIYKEYVNFRATGSIDVIAAVKERDRLRAVNRELVRALNEIAILAEYNTTGQNTMPRCKSDALTKDQATALRGSISEIARAALARQA